MSRWSIIVIITVLLSVGAVYLYYWQPEEELIGVVVTPEEQKASSLLLGVPEVRTRNITLFVGDAARSTLIETPYEIEKKPDIVQELSDAVRLLIHPATPDTRNEAMPEGTELLNVFLTPAGIAYLNLNRNLQDRHIGGLSAELATITALVNTVLANFQEVKQVQILVEGAEIETLAGHVDCRKPFSRLLPLQNL